MRSRRCAKRKLKRGLIHHGAKQLASPSLSGRIPHLSSEAVDVDEVIFCVLDSLVDGNPETESAATNAVLSFAQRQQNFTIRAILHFLEVQRTTESHQHVLLTLLRKCITQSHETIPTTVMRDVLLFMLKELNFLEPGDLRQSVIVEAVNETAVLCPAFSVEVILAFIRDMRQESSCLTETLSIYIRVLAHVYLHACNNDYIRSVDVVGQILSLYDHSTLSVDSGELCKNLTALLYTLSKALYSLQEWTSDDDTIAKPFELCEALALEDAAGDRFSLWFARYLEYRPSVGPGNEEQSETMAVEHLGTLTDNAPPSESDLIWSARSQDAMSQTSGNRPVVRSLRLGSHKRVLSFAAALCATGSGGECTYRGCSGGENGHNISARKANTSIDRMEIGRYDVSLTHIPHICDANILYANNHTPPKRQFTTFGAMGHRHRAHHSGTKGVRRIGSGWFLSAAGVPQISPDVWVQSITRNHAAGRDTVLQTVSGPMGIPTVGIPADFQDVLEPLFELMIARSLASIYTHPHYHVTCMETLFALSLLSKHVSVAVLVRCGLTLLDSVVVRFYHYIPNMQYHPLSVQGHTSVWMALHKESSDTYRNKIVTIFSSIGAYGDKISMLPPTALVMSLLHLCKVLMQRHPHSVVCQLPNICEVLFGMFMGLHACGKATLLASCDSSFITFCADEEDLLLRRSAISEFLDVTSASSCKDFVRSLVIACRFFASVPDTRCYFIDFLFRKTSCNSDKEVSVALFMLGWSCSLPSLRDSLTLSRCVTAPARHFGMRGALYWRIIDTLQQLLRRMPIASANPLILRLMLTLINHLSRGQWLLLHCLAGYRNSTNYGVDFSPEETDITIPRRIHALIDFVFSLKVVYDLEKRIAENSNKANTVNPKLTPEFFRKIYCGHHTSNYDLCLLVCGSRSFERFLLTHSGDIMLMYLVQVMLTNSKMSVFSALRSICSLFSRCTVESISRRCSVSAYSRLLAFVLVYLHDPFNYFGEAFAAAKALPYITQVLFGQRLELTTGVNDTWHKSNYTGLDSYMLSFEPGECYSSLSGKDYIVLHFEKISNVLHQMAESTSFAKSAADVIQQLCRICQSIKPPPATYTSLLKLGNVHSSSLMTMYHSLGILHTIAAYSRLSVDLCSTLVDILLGYRGTTATGIWDNNFALDETISPLVPNVAKWAPLALTVSEQLRYTMLQLGMFMRSRMDPPQEVEWYLDHTLHDYHLMFVHQPDDYLQQESYILMGHIISTLGMYTPYYRCVLWKVYYALRSRLPSTGALFTKFSGSSFGEPLKVIAITALGYLYNSAPTESIDQCFTVRPTDLGKLAVEVSRHHELLYTPTEESHMIHMYNCCFREKYEETVSNDLAADCGILRCIVAPMLYYTFFETDPTVQLAIARTYLLTLRSFNTTNQHNVDVRFPFTALRRILYFVSKPTLKEFGGNQHYDSSALEQQCAYLFNCARWDLNFPDVRAFENAGFKSPTETITCSNVSLGFFAAICHLSDTLTTSDSVLPSLHVVLSFMDYWKTNVESHGSTGTTTGIDVRALTTRFMRNCVEKSGWHRLAHVLAMTLFLTEEFPKDLVEHRVSLAVEFLDGIDLSSYASVHTCNECDYKHSNHGNVERNGSREDIAAIATVDRNEIGNGETVAQEVTLSDQIDLNVDGSKSVIIETEQHGGHETSENDSAVTSTGEEDHMRYVECVLLLWAHMLRLDTGNALRASVRCCLERLLYINAPEMCSVVPPVGSMTTDSEVYSEHCSITHCDNDEVSHIGGNRTISNQFAMLEHREVDTTVVVPPLKSPLLSREAYLVHTSCRVVANVERIDLLVPKESLMLALLCCMKYLSTSSCISGPFAEILQLILQQRYSDLDHEHLESILATIFSNFSSAFEQKDVPCSLHNFVVDLAQTDFEVLCNVIFASKCNYSQSFKLSVTALITCNAWLMLQLLEFLEMSLLSKYQQRPSSRYSVPMDYILDFLEKIYLHSEHEILRSEEGVRFVTALVLHFNFLAKSDNNENVQVMTWFRTLADRLVVHESSVSGLNNGSGDAGSAARTPWLSNTAQSDADMPNIDHAVLRSCRALLRSSECYIKCFITFLEGTLQHRFDFKSAFLRVCLSLFCNLLRDGAFGLYGATVLGLIHKITLSKEHQRIYYRSLHYYLHYVELVPMSPYTRRFRCLGSLSRVRQDVTYQMSDEGPEPIERSEHTNNAPTVFKGSLPMLTDGVDGLRRCVLDRLVVSILDDISQPLPNDVLYCLERAAASLIRYATERRHHRVRNIRVLVARILRSYDILSRREPSLLYAFGELYLAITRWIQGCMARGMILPVEVQRHLLPPLAMSLLHKSGSIRSGAVYRRLIRVIVQILSDHPVDNEISTDSGSGWMKGVLLRHPRSVEITKSTDLCLCGCNNPHLRHHSGQRFCVCNAFYLLDVFSSCFPSYSCALDMSVTESIDSEMARLRRDEHMKRTSQVLFGNSSDVSVDSPMVLGALAAVSCSGEDAEDDRDFVDLNDIYRVRMPHISKNTTSSTRGNVISKFSPTVMLTARSMRSTSFDNANAFFREMKRAVSADPRMVGADTTDECMISFDLLSRLSINAGDGIGLETWNSMKETLEQSTSSNNTAVEQRFDSLESVSDKSDVALYLATAGQSDTVTSITERDANGRDVYTEEGAKLTKEQLAESNGHLGEPVNLKSGCMTPLEMRKEDNNKGSILEELQRTDTKDEIDIATFNRINKRFRRHTAMQHPLFYKGSLACTSLSESAMSRLENSGYVPGKGAGAWNTQVLKSTWFGRPVPINNESLVLPQSTESVESTEFKRADHRNRRSMGRTLETLPCIPSLMQLLSIADFQFQSDGLLKRINAFTNEQVGGRTTDEPTQVYRDVTFFDISNLESVWNSTLYTSPVVYRYLLLSRYTTRPRLYISLGGEQRPRPVSRHLQHAPAQSPIIAAVKRELHAEVQATGKTGQPNPLKDKPSVTQPVVEPTKDAFEPEVPEHVIVNAVRGSAAILHMALLHLTEEEELLRQYIVDRWPRCFVEMARYNAIMHFEACAKVTAKQLCKMLYGASGLVKRVLLESMEVFAMVRSNSLHCD
ncbi:uncharacterized protein BXIN_0329 [Babesia sp. Xinjiang]|uniref:uncharacterized protein n=1 Tax=Babesia sp. Xinjiang TaxID=462227 RepID=UPI000A265C3B|nr:uncharacterized protein BXIN_0278 [Babesia sp. Xinjiang]XP_028871602.1 uncharacterized protein BXIN_0329 [Babesia sp. Xinjiang]ORM41097.1 hypothetical protein BXIN_0278 [Babesia sp. Xinjiang]ORM41146.1 hypothetical protein BXIN_0329 [Babesia sp. Xinjiang]